MDRQIGGAESSESVIRASNALVEQNGCIGKQMTDPRVSIILVNWNGWKDTVECLESVFQNEYSNYDVVVIDNGSQDESVEMIKRYAAGNIDITSDFFVFSKDNKPIDYSEYSYDHSDASSMDLQIGTGISSSKKLILVKCSKNYGFAEGNNIAINYVMRLFDPKYILLLNNDTVVDRHFLVELVNGVKSSENAGVVGPKMYYYDYNGRKDVINYAGAEFLRLPSLARHIGNGEIDVGQYDRTSRTDYVNGAAFLINRDAINTIGVLKSHYFLYWEETDFCVRARKAGYHLYYIPSSKIWHKASRSTNKISGQKTYYFTRNTFWFIRDNSEWGQYAYFLVCFFGILVWFRLFEIIIQGGGIKCIGSFFRGIIDGVRSV